jgi:hypothetical protein
MSLCHGHFCSIVIFPQEPTGLALEGEVHFTWGASTGTVKGYRIYWGTTEGGPYPSQLCDVNGTTLEYTADIVFDKTYYMICRAYNNIGESGNSNEVILK